MKLTPEQLKYKEFFLSLDAPLRVEILSLMTIWHNETLIKKMKDIVEKFNPDPQDRR